MMDIKFNRSLSSHLGYYNFVFRVPRGARDFKVIQRSASKKPDMIALGTLPESCFYFVISMLKLMLNVHKLA